jgi:uncharacterized protein YcgI (DUF1989 family)
MTITTTVRTAGDRALRTTVPVAPPFAEGTVLDAAGPAVAGAVVRDDTVAPLAPWSAIIPAGHVLTIVDVGGNQSADCLIYDAHDTDERYSVPDTLAWQGNAYIREGSVLRSNLGHPLMTVVANEIDRQDTIGGACSKESNTLRYGHHTWSQHACVDNFLAEGARHGLGKRVAIRAERDVLVIVSNCPQLNNPCNDFNCTPLRMIVTAPTTGTDAA